MATEAGKEGGQQNLPGTGQAGPVVPLDTKGKAEDLEALRANAVKIENENKDLKKQLEETGKRVKELQDTIVTPEYLEFLTTKGKRGKDDKTTPDKPGKDDSVDIEGMTNTELAQFIVSQVKGEITKAVSPIVARTEHTDVKLQVQEAAARYPDFWEYKDAMVQISDRMPHLSPAEVYVMVKGIEASTGKTLKVQKSETGREGEPGGRPVGSEVGTGPDLSLGETGQKLPATYAEAAGRAWDRVFNKK